MLQANLLRDYLHFAWKKINQQLTAANIKNTSSIVTLL